MVFIKQNTSKIFDMLPKDRINPDAVRLMKQLYGIDAEQGRRPKLLAEIPPVDVVVTMGCGVRCPSCQASGGKTGTLPIRRANRTTHSFPSSERSKRKSSP